MCWVLPVFVVELRGCQVVGWGLLPRVGVGKHSGEVRVAAIYQFLKQLVIATTHNGDTLSLLMCSVTQHDRRLACPPLADLAVGAPARGGIPLPGQGLSHLVDHELHDELLVFILVVTDEWHGGAHNLGEEKGPSEERSRRCM